jgi:class 3 adenylate cyclase
LRNVLEKELRQASVAEYVRTELHREFKNLLETAQGSSEMIVAIFIDVRGFSSFSRTADSVQVAIFIKEVYKKIINTYFPDATFFKPTGDGLLIVLACYEKNVEKLVPSAISKCQEIVNGFSIFCKGTHLINFPVPDRVGIGVARGPATRLESEGKILDYSGNTLNLAARIVDIARPTGVVFHDSVGIQLLPENLQPVFSKTAVYLRGVAESVPVTVYYDHRLTRIPEGNKHPFNVRWERWQRAVTLGDIEHSLKLNVQESIFRLTSKPFDPKQISVDVAWKRGATKGKVLRQSFHDFKYVQEGSEAKLSLDLARLAQQLKANKEITRKSELKIRAIYPTIEYSTESK